MTTPCSTATNHNFYCVAKASLNLINLPLIDILANHVRDKDLFEKIDSSQSLLSGRYKLRSDQLKICYIQPPDIPDYNKFDVTLLYTLIRNLCPLLRPTQGWGNEPHTTDTKLGDDIERLRLFRNKSYAHAASDTIPDAEFETLWKDLKSVISRIQSNPQTGCSVNYEESMVAIENSKFTNKCWEECKILLLTLWKLETYGKDEPDVVVKGKDEVICGDLARFEAVLKPDSSCWSITWQKRRGKVTENIDSSKKKYSGSTNRTLVIKSVCKEDEGEYQVLLSHESNGNRYIQCGNSICLHVFGELPILKDLEVTAEDEGIIIRYSYNVSVQSPKVQHIEWSKNDQVLDTNTSKFVGGSIHDRSFKIRSPTTEEDKGKYSCKITNAVGSVSKSVMLGVPIVDISANSTVHFGSKVIIAAVVSSTPSPEHVIWQKSKNGNNFQCIDITKPKYYGSNDTRFKPLLVIPRATFDDKLYYRLLVRNKIRESISDTVYLNVTGSPPNVQTGQETNIKSKILKLIGNASLFDDSPDILDVFWTKNGKRIDTLGSGGRLSELTNDNTSLIIRDVNVDDAGNYQFTAVNAVGSTTSDVIVLDVPEVFFEKTENNEDGTKSYLVTIQSVPSPFSVQWSSKGTDEDVYTAIDVNKEEYKGTLNTLPHPVLVVEKNKLENYNYQIEVANFIGCTVKQISDNQHHPTENKTKENKLYKDRDAGIKFAKLSYYLAKQFPHQELDKLKLILQASGKVENVSALMSAKSASECFSILNNENLFTQKDVIFVQFLCKETGCNELYSQCIKYAETNKALCYFEKPPDNGYKNVQFHIQGNLNDYTKEQIKHIVEVVADILNCETQEIFVNGLKPWNSFYLVLSLKEVYTWKLLKMTELDRLRLFILNIDSFILDQITYSLRRFEDRLSLEALWEHMLTNSQKHHHGGREIETGREKEDKNIYEKDKSLAKYIPQRLIRSQVAAKDDENLQLQIESIENILEHETSENCHWKLTMNDLIVPNFLLTPPSNESILEPIGVRVATVDQQSDKPKKPLMESPIYSDTDPEKSYELKQRVLKNGQIRCIECVKAFQVFSSNEIEAGDHVVFSGDVYEHHGIIISKSDDGETFEIIEAINNIFGAVLGVSEVFGIKADIKCSFKKFDFDREKICVVVYRHRYSKKDTLRRAIGIYSDKEKSLNYKYVLSDNNCEHFATYCVTGHKFRVQVSKFQLTLKLLWSSGFVGVSDELERYKREFENNIICKDCYEMNKQLLSVNVKPIVLEEDVQKGDIIRYSYWNLWHDAVVLEVSQTNKKAVVCFIAHYAFCGLFSHRTIRVERKEFKLNGQCFKLDYAPTQFDVYKPDEVVKRARKRLGEQLFVLFSNDSSHFARWCKLKIMGF